MTASAGDMAPRQGALHVVVTRPLAQAAAWVERLAQYGLHAEMFPLLDIRALTDQPALYKKLCGKLAALADYDLIVFVSPNAVLKCVEALGSTAHAAPHWPHTLSFAVVGEGSLQALRDNGVNEDSHQIIAPGKGEAAGSESLIAALDARWQAGQRWRRVLIVRGDGGRELIAEWLQAHQSEVNYVQAYQRYLPPATTQTNQSLLHLIASGAIWLITSSQAMQHLDAQITGLSGECGLAEQANLQIVSIRNTLPIVVPHERIRKTAIEAGYRRVCLAGLGIDPLINAIHSVAPLST